MDIVIDSSNYMGDREYELVQSCKKFMSDFNNVQVRYVYNPFTDRKIKKGTSTYTSLYHQVKKYLENLDDEEFHSPIHIKELYIDIVSPRSNNLIIDHRLSKNVLETDTISKDWYKKVEKKLKIIAKTTDESENILCDYWIFFTPLENITDEELEMKKMKWIQNNPELYSFLDHYKPEVFQTKFICKHLYQYQFVFHQFTEWLQHTCELFIKKSFESFSSTIPIDNRYPVAMISLWIYQPLIFHARKFIKKNNKVIQEFIMKKPVKQVKLSSRHVSSFLIAYFIFKTKIEHLEKVKLDYQTYFEKYLKEGLEFIDKENILYRPYYKQSITEFLQGRIRPYRYTNVTFTNLELFDKLIYRLENPNKPPLEEITIDDSQDSEEDEEDSPKQSTKESKEEIMDE